MKITKEKTLAICMVFLVASIGMVTGDMTEYPTVLISPYADIIPTMDGQIGDGEWADANSVTLTAISNMSREHGKVYIKNTPYTLYILMDCYAPHAEGIDNWLTAGVYFDTNNDGTFASGYEEYVYATADQGAVYTEFLAKVEEYGIANNPSPNNPNPHWIFEYAIPLKQCRLYNKKNMGVHFLLDGHLKDYVSEWANPTEDFDYDFPERWADLRLTDLQVSVETDYCPLDTTTLVTLDVDNPTNSPVTLEWYIGSPQSDYWELYANVSIPAGFSNTTRNPVPSGDWGSTPFGLVHYVHLLDPVSGDVLAQDAAFSIHHTTCYD